MATMPDSSVDSMVTDAPYGLSDFDARTVAETLLKWLTTDRMAAPAGRGFMGKQWDAFIPPPGIWDEAFRVLRPGAFLLCFASPRTYDLMALSIRLAGFDVRDSIDWIFGTGFPKSIDMARDVEMHLCRKQGRHFDKHLPAKVKRKRGDHLCPAGTAEAAEFLRGWGSALKPSHEPIVMARKPLHGTYAANALEHRTGGLNIAASRIGTTKAVPVSESTSHSVVAFGRWLGPGGQGSGFDPNIGRWPSNVVFQHQDECGAKYAPGCPVAELERQSGETGAFAPVRGTEPSAAVTPAGITGERARVLGAFHGDSGGASRFFYAAKPTREERDFGCAALPSRASLDTVGRELDSIGVQNPRAGAGRGAGRALSPQKMRCEVCGIILVDGRERTACGKNKVHKPVALVGDAKGNLNTEGMVQAKNHHPTVKSWDLMRYLVRLVTPAGGVTLDPFAGSGTSGMAAVAEGFRFIGCELALEHPEYLDIARARILAAELHKHEPQRVDDSTALPGQMRLFGSAS